MIFSTSSKNFGRLKLFFDSAAKRRVEQILVSNETNCQSLFWKHFKNCVFWKNTRSVDSDKHAVWLVFLVIFFIENESRDPFAGAFQEFDIDDLNVFFLQLFVDLRGKPYWFKRIFGVDFDFFAIHG